LVEVNYAAMRAAMVASQLRTSDVNDAAVIAAMSKVSREDFVPASRREMAYVDRPVPLESGKVMNPPLVTGLLLTVAQLRAGDKVLLLGDNTGYTAALLDHIGVQVTAVADVAKPKSAPAGVAWIMADPAKGDLENAPYDVVIVEGAVEGLPAAVTQQLVDGGRVALGLIKRGVSRLCSGRKAGDSIGFVSRYDMDMAVLSGFAPASDAFTF